MHVAGCPPAPGCGIRLNRLGKDRLMELQGRCRGLRYGGSRPRRDASRNRSTQPCAVGLYRRPRAGGSAGPSGLPCGLGGLRRQGGRQWPVMRCAPLAIRWRHDDVTLVRNVVCSAAVTHWDSRCIWSSVLVNLAIASLPREPPDSPLKLVERGAWRPVRLGRHSKALARPGCEAAGRPDRDGGMGRPSDDVDDGEGCRARLNRVQASADAAFTRIP